MTYRKSVGNTSSCPEYHFLFLGDTPSFPLHRKLSDPPILTLSLNMSTWPPEQKLSKHQHLLLKFLFFILTSLPAGWDIPSLSLPISLRPLDAHQLPWHPPQRVVHAPLSFLSATIAVLGVVFQYTCYALSHCHPLLRGR